MRKYRRNPHYTEPLAINGIVFGNDDVAEGPEWEMWTRPQFPGIEPSLIQAPDSARVTLHSLVTGVPKGIKDDRRFVPTPEARDAASVARDSLAATALAMDAEREAVEAKELEEAVEAPPEAPVARISPDQDSAPSLLSVPSIEEGMETSSPSDLTQLAGVGARTAKALSSVGYETVNDLAGADPGEMAKAVRKGGTKMSLGTARSIVRKAKAVVG